MEYAITHDEEAEAYYIDLTPNRTKYPGISVRQLKVDLSKENFLRDPFTKLLLDFDRDGRVLGIEVI